MTIPSLEPIPSRRNKSTFSAYLDALLAKLPAWGVAVDAVAAQATIDAATAETAADEATAAAANASASANVTKWISGTTYAEGDGVWSPITFLTYRRKSAGGGTTDPSLDSANWQVLGGAGLGANSFTGAQNFARATVASHATTSAIWAAAGNQIDFTGTAAVTAFPNAAQAGSERVLICDGACSFTAGANMLIDGVASGSTVTCAAGDQMIVRAISTTQFKLSRIKYDGTPQVSSGFAGASTITDNVTLTSASDCIQYVNVTAYGKAITLPNATTLTAGPMKFVVVVSANSHPIGIKDGSGQVLGQAVPGRTVRLQLLSNGVAAGTWEVDDLEFGRWWQTDRTGTNIYYPPQGFLNLSDTASFIFYQNVSGYPCVRYMSHPTGGGFTIGAEYVLRAASESVNIPNTIILGATNRALVTTSTKYSVIVDYSAGPTLTVGSAVSTGLTSLSSKAPSNLDDRYVLMNGYVNSPTAFEAVCADCGASGTTLSFGSLATWTPSIGTGSTVYTQTKKVSATQVACLVRYEYNSSYNKVEMATATRGSGTAVSWGSSIGVPGSWRTSDTTQIYPIYELSGDRFLYPYYSSGYAEYFVIGTFAATPSWGTAVAGGLTLNAHDLTTSKCGAEAFVYAGTQVTTVKLGLLTISGTTITIRTPVTISKAYASGSAVVPYASELDGKGIVSYGLNASGYLGYVGFAVNGTTLSIGSTTGSIANTTADQKIMNAGTESLIRTDGTATPARLWYAANYNISYDYNTIAMLISIDASGEVTLSAPCVLGIDMSQPVLAGYAPTNDRKILYGGARRRFNGVIIDGVMKIGFGHPMNYSNFSSFMFDSSKSFFTYGPQHSIEGNNYVFERWYPAEA